MNQPLDPDDNFALIKRALQDFQAKRIRSTYADLMEVPEYTKQGEFFFEQITALRISAFETKA